MLLSLAISTIAVKIAITLNGNELIRQFGEWRATRTRMKAAKRCGHVWTLFPASPYSQCNFCMAVIATTTLQFARDYAEVKPFIAGIRHGEVLTPGEGRIYVSDHIGNRK